MIIVLNCLAWIYYFMPGFIQAGLGNALGFLLRVFKYRAQVIEQNLKYAFPTEAQTRERVFRQAYSHFGGLVLEILLLFGPMGKFIERRGELIGVENWRAAIAQGKGAIFLSSHVGNWEMMAATGAMKGPMDLMIVTKHLKPEWLHRAIEKARARVGVKATYEPRTLKDVLRQLKSAQTVGFVLDQYAGPPVGVRVPVFGIPVGTMTAVAFLAKRTGAAVLPVVNFMTREGKTRTEIRPALEWIKDVDSSREIALNTARYAKVMEADIYLHPDQWLWVHRRFKGDLSPLRPEEWSESRKR
jgi:KDO2-lipid IV(A) lauroyltransferase